MTEDAKAEALRLAKEAGFLVNVETNPLFVCVDRDVIRELEASFVRLIALARAPQAGWVLVPKEPTDAMIQAMQASMYDDGPAKRGHIEYALWEQVYGDLLAAAPNAQEE